MSDDEVMNGGLLIWCDKGMMIENNKMEDFLYYYGMNGWSDQESVRF